MIVASDWDDDTWHIHLDGYLRLLQQSSGEVIYTASTRTLEQALKFVRVETNETSSFDDIARSDMHKALLLLNISKLRLRTLAREFRRLTEGATRPRKLDVQRIRSLAKQLFDDLGLMRPASSPSRLDVFGTLPMEHAALRVVAGGILIECGNILDTTGAFDITRQCVKLTSSTRLAATEILAIAAATFPGLRGGELTDVDHGKANASQHLMISTPLSVMWPLFAACISAGSDHAQRTWARQTLSYIGEHYSIPRALHLVCIS